MTRLLLLTHAKQHYIMQASWLNDAYPVISEATSRLASENDSSSYTKDPFASVDEDKGELEDNEIVF